ncbi:PAS domain S-box [Planoprotostelium fungivorum]|uniref:PAS domain S-box n=1 Tax=Planoprotostelium fungivorum TaxID=1890364 RepID=A0A2P6N390_9EUKA|nr:PAS domain S-box [Planoprotostelium fungivorum]
MDEDLRYTQSVLQIEYELKRTRSLLAAVSLAIDNYSSTSICITDMDGNISFCGETAASLISTFTTTLGIHSASSLEGRNLLGLIAGDMNTELLNIQPGSKFTAEVQTKTLEGKDVSLRIEGQPDSNGWMMYKLSPGDDEFERYVDMYSEIMGSSNTPHLLWRMENTRTPDGNPAFSLVYHNDSARPLLDHTKNIKRGLCLHNMFTGQDLQTLTSSLTACIKERKTLDVPRVLLDGVLLSLRLRSLRMGLISVTMETIVDRKQEFSQKIQTTVGAVGGAPKFPLVEGHEQLPLLMANSAHLLPFAFGIWYQEQYDNGDAKFTFVWSNHISALYRREGYTPHVGMDYTDMFPAYKGRNEYFNAIRDSPVGTYFSYILTDQINSQYRPGVWKGYKYKIADRYLAIMGESISFETSKKDEDTIVNATQRQRLPQPVDGVWYYGDALASMSMALPQPLGKENLPGMSHLQFLGRNSGNAAPRSQLPPQASMMTANRWAEIYKKAPIGIILADPNTNTIIANDKFKQMLGYKDSDPYGRDGLVVPERTHPDDMDRTILLSQEIASGRMRDVHYVKRYIHKEGHSVHVFVMSTTIQDESDRINFVSSYVLTLDEIRLGVEDLQTLLREEEIWQPFSSFCTDKVCLLNRAGIVRNANIAFLSKMRMNKRDLMRDVKLESLIANVGLDDYVRSRNALLAGAADKMDVICAIIDGANEVMWTTISMRAIRDMNLNLTHTIIFLLDAAGPNNFNFEWMRRMNS